ncbi:DUF362 domain-containing protein [Candidatus Microgenomates bacterium]|nr:DUF362 domain-containing protein [Candidatus Microgenomates bacterium]
MSKVYLTKTSPATVIEDYQLLMRTADYKKHFKKNQPVVIKLNLSWTRFYPGCSSWPWQLEGIVKTLLEDGFKASQIIPVENKTVVTDVKKGAHNNKWLGVLKKYGIKMHYLTETKYVEYKPKHKMLVLDKVFPRGILLPKIIFGANLIHPPTLKMHVFTTTTGAIKNYFGMLNTKRHLCHRFIHEAIVDLLTIQKEIHPGIFAITDGVTAGEGSGPRAMKWHIKNLLLASNDQVALDSVSAKIMGFNPRKIKFLKMANKLGLGDIEARVCQMTNDKCQNDKSKIKISKKDPIRETDFAAGSLQNFCCSQLANLRAVREHKNFRKRPQPQKYGSQTRKNSWSTSALAVEESLSLPNFHFKKADTFASKGQKLIYGGPKWLERFLLQTPLVPWSYMASNLYHDYYWYNLTGQKRVKKFLKTDWGKKFLSYR